MKARKGTITFAIEIALVIILVIVGWYFALPALNLHSTMTWIGVIVIILSFAILLFWNKNRLEDCIWRDRRDISKEEKDEMQDRAKTLLNIATYLAIATVFVFALFLLGKLSSSRIIHADRYRNIANVENGNFAEDFPEADPTGSNISFVSMEIAQQLGDRTIANVKGAELYEVDDEYNLIEYKGDYYRISSLNYGGLFKYMKASSNGIPGYVLVNTRTQKASFCEVEGGYYYSPSAHFEKNLFRHLRIQYPTSIFDTKSYFEIDEEGNPYWITPIISKTIGLFGGDKVENIIITDAVTGDSVVYNVENLPKWVDHAMILDYLKQKATDYYELVHGALNFSDEDVKKLSIGYTSFVNEKGEVCFTMGLTPANEAKSNVGFILINSRTGQIKEYIADGIQEETARKRVETLVQNYGYKATFPQVINIEGIPTYLMCLVGSDGLIQDVALACISTSSNATAYANTLDEAITKYKAELGKSGAIEPEQQGEEIYVEGKITSIHCADIEGTTYFFYVLENDDKQLYKASITINERQVLLKEGNEVKLTYNSDGDVIDVISIEIK